MIYDLWNLGPCACARADTVSLPIGLYRDTYGIPAGSRDGGSTGPRTSLAWLWTTMSRRFRAQVSVGGVSRAWLNDGAGHSRR